jgi:hypothetical protein
MDERFAVVSAARMDDAAWGGASDGQRLELRLRKMVTKNLRILYFGLDKAPTAGASCSGRSWGSATSGLQQAR